MTKFCISRLLDEGEAGSSKGGVTVKRLSHSNDYFAGSTVVGIHYT